MAEAPREADAEVTVDEKALEAVEVSAAPAPGGPGMPGGRWAAAWAVTAPWAAPALPAHGPAEPARRGPRADAGPAARQVAARRRVLLAAAALAAGCGRCGGDARGRPRLAGARSRVVNGEPIAADALARELREARAGDGGEGRLPDAAPPPRARRARRSRPAPRRRRARAVDRGRARTRSSARSCALRAEYPGHALRRPARAGAAQPGRAQGAPPDAARPSSGSSRGRSSRSVQVADAEVARHYADHAAEFQDAGAGARAPDRGRVEGGGGGGPRRSSGGTRRRSPRWRGSPRSRPEGKDGRRPRLHRARLRASRRSSTSASRSR